MAEAVVEKVFEKLISLVVEEELGRFLGLDREKKKLASSLTTIKAFIQDAEEKQFSNEAMMDWLRMLRDAAYEVEDILEEYAYEKLGFEHQRLKLKGISEKVQSSCLSSFHPKHVVFRYKLARKMKRVSERLDEVAQEGHKFHLTETLPKKITGLLQGCHRTNSVITQPQLYGRKQDTEKILNSLIADASRSEHVSVIPIVGLGGVGKTTLAQCIYNDQRVLNHFDLRMWVCVSEDSSLKRITEAIIQAASGRACDDFDLEPLQRKLQNLLQQKRYLLVLDDAWDCLWDDEHDRWGGLKSVLACGAKGSSVLVTTRLSKTAAIMGTMPPHVISELSDDDCWKLLKHHAFAQGDVVPSQLVDLGKEIAKKCHGLPLAAKTLGSLLFKTEKEEWLKVKESSQWSSPHKENSIPPALRLSYLDLPTYLKPCFTYFAIYPKHARILMRNLIDLWMAEGFISSNEKSGYEDDADRVWKELYSRSFFQDIEKDQFGKVTSFRLHNLVHDLAQSVAGDIRCITDDSDVAALSKKIHHLSDHRQMMWHSHQEPNLLEHKSLRTCIMSHRYSTAQNFPHILKCHSLRVLLCQPTKEELSSSIGHLKHLRYLNLSGRDLKTIPDSVCKLWNLQTLILDNCKHLQKLPDDLPHVKALQQLSLKGCSSLSCLPPRIGKLTSLTRLTMFFVRKERGSLLEELGPLKLKGDLYINHLEKVKSVMDAIDANMSSKQLNMLSLSWDKNEDSKLQENIEQIVEVLQPDTQQLQTLRVVGYKGAYLPQWMSTPSLEKLEIEGCLKFDISAGFQFLTCLQDLSIGECREVDSLNEALQHMTALYSLRLWNLPNLEALPDCFGNLASLRELSIENCSKLTCLPMSLSLCNLKGLWIYNCPELEKRCKETGEDWPKIAHIPHIRVFSMLL